MQRKEITTIKLTKKTKERIDKLRVHKRETYEEILQSILGILSIARTNPQRAQARLISIEKQKRRMRKDD